MTDPHPSAGHGPNHATHPGPDFKLYLVIAAALAGFTAISFIVNLLVHMKAFTPFVGFLIILSVAVCKAVLVGMFFMHIKYDWPLLYFMLVPAFILATMMMIVLLPDIVIAWHHEPATQTGSASESPPQH
jgi:caa(3)-type oxidase subunit IV